MRDFHTIGICRFREASDVLFNEGFPADYVYVLCSGHVKLLASSPEGRLLILRVASPGDMLGLGALLSSAVYCVTAQTLSPCTIKSIPREDFIRFVFAYPQVSLLAAETLARDYNCAVLAARRFALSTSAASKLASALLDWAYSGSPNSRGAHANLPIAFPAYVTHEDLGSMAGLSRETVCRLIGIFRRQGLIKLARQRMTLIDPRRMDSLYCEKPLRIPLAPLHLTP
ncbi:MAG: Crp/Fnr family transcriptional regulator [Acidobacteriaceae bacterium]